MWHSPRESRGLSASENVGPPDGGNFRPETLGSTSVSEWNVSNHCYVQCCLCSEIMEHTNIKPHIAEIHDTNEKLRFIEWDENNQIYYYVKCSYCNNIMDNTYIKPHVTENHGAEKPLIFSIWKETNKTYIQCSFCDDNSMKFFHPNIKKHITEKHGQNKPFVFREVSESEHRGNRHKCSYCNKKHDSKQNLKKHLLMYHELPYKFRIQILFQ